jgi:hypothetical protein
MDAAAKSAKARVMRLAKAWGCVVESGVVGLTYEATVTAPEGQHFADELHEYVGSTYAGPWSYAAAWDDLAAKMEAGAPERCHDGCEFWED